MVDSYSNLASLIIKGQTEIIGPVAIEQAKKVEGIVIHGDEIIISGDIKVVLEQLVNQYAKLFGRASIEVCKDAIKGMITSVPKDQIPQILL